MNVFSTDKIRNVAILGHGGAGKTTLVEGMANITGLTSRLGTVTDGNTISDYDKEEQKRKFSINMSMVPIVWGDTKINFLDAPGYFDFVGEMEAACLAADAAVIVVNGKSGVEVGTQKAWNLCDRYNLPRILWVSNVDFEHADYVKLIDDLKELYGDQIAPIALPVKNGDKLTGYFDVLAQKGFTYADKGKVNAGDAAGEVIGDPEGIYEALMETIAGTSEELMEVYFDTMELSAAQIAEGMKLGVSDCAVMPLIPGSGNNLQGIAPLLDAIVAYAPAPSARKISGVNVKTDEPFDADYDESKPKSAFVFKSIVDPFMGKYSFIKVASGSIKSDDTLYDSERDNEFRVSKLYVFQGSKTIEVPELKAGDIGAIGKLDVATGDTLSTKATPIAFPKPQFSVPYTYKRYLAVKKGDEDKISSALNRLAQEDPTMKVVNDGENRQTLIFGMGDQHIDIIMSKLLGKYKVEAELAQPKVAFRETLRKKSDVDSKYKKQSGGHGQYGHVKMTFEPSNELETPYVFEQIVVGGAVPKNYFPAVEKGIQESVQKGPLAGYPVVGVKAVLYDGSYHPVDSSEMAFKTAASQAFKKGFMDASPVLLEPIASVKVTVPDKFTGDVMGDLNKRRGRVLGMNPDHKGNTIVEADVPMSEMYGYSTQLRSMTGGSGDFSYEFARYEQAPADVQEKEVKARAEESEE